jgi:LCP family protein required for cell wall assembly
MNSNVHLVLEYKKPRLFIRILLWAFGLIFLGISALLIYLNIKSNQLIKDFTEAANISKEELLNTSTSVVEQFQNNYKKIADLPQKYNFLLLGTDKLTGRTNDPELTDTVILLQVNFADGKIKTLSLPRDLYLEDYQTKINALYVYGKEKSPDQPEGFPKEVIEQLTNLKIDNVIVIAIEDLEKLINIIGGIEINVPAAFTDSQFPVQDVDVSVVTDPAILYEEVSFEKGWQQMDSLTALKYMRSRHSEGEQGTDDARAQRQQLVIQAMFNKLTTIQNVKVYGQLYRFYLNSFAKYISLEEIVQILTIGIDYLSKNELNSISFEKYQLGIYPNDENGIIYNPPLWQSNQQWVYKIKDLTKFNEKINAIFN